MSCKIKNVDGVDTIEIYDGKRVNFGQDGVDLDIEFSTADHTFYKPGDKLKGEIVLKTTRPLQAKSLQLVVHSDAVLMVPSVLQDQFVLRESYMKQKKHLMGKPKGEGMLTLDAKTHRAKFEIDLPADTPATVNYKDSNIHFVIRFFATVTIYESKYSTTHQAKILNPILSTSRQFLFHHPMSEGQLESLMQRVSYDILKQGGGGGLGCFAKQRTPVATVNLGREVYFLGDKIRATVCYPTSAKKPSKIVMTLEQQTEIPGYENLMWAHDVVTTHRDTKEVSASTAADEGLAFHLPVSHHLIPSHMGQVSIIKLTYFLRVDIEYGSSFSSNQVTRVPIYVVPGRDIDNVKIRYAKEGKGGYGHSHDFYDATATGD